MIVSTVMNASCYKNNIYQGNIWLALSKYNMLTQINAWTNNNIIK